MITRLCRRVSDRFIAHEPRSGRSCRITVTLVMAVHGALLALWWTAVAHRQLPPAPREVPVMVSLSSPAAAVERPPAPGSVPAPAPAPARPATLAATASPSRQVTQLPQTGPAAPSTVADPVADTMAASTAPSATGAEPGPPVAESVTAPRFDAAYLLNPAPAYPPLSRKAREQGAVLLRVQVDEQGLAREVRLQTSSGHERLDHAALSAVARWKFQPARQGSRTLSAWVVVPIIFALKD